MTKVTAQALGVLITLLAVGDCQISSIFRPNLQSIRQAMMTTPASSDVLFSNETTSTQRSHYLFDSLSNLTSVSDLEDPSYCSALTWNFGWIAVATNAFPVVTHCCGRRIVGWKLFDDVHHELKGSPNAPPYCFYTKRLGSELVMKTLVATKCGLINRLRCGESTRFRCNYSTNRCIPIHLNEIEQPPRRPFIMPLDVGQS